MEVPMPATASAEELREARDQVNDFQRDLEEAVRRLRREPGSDGKAKAEPVLGEKLAWAMKMGGLLGLGSNPATAAAAATAITPDTVRDIDTYIRGNISLLKKLVEDLTGLIKVIVESVVDIVKTLIKGLLDIFAVFEETIGKANIKQVNPSTYIVDGASSEVRMRFGTSFQKHGLPATAGPYSGSWQATLVKDGIDAHGNERYTVVDYARTPGDIEIGPASLTGIRQALDVTQTSTIVVTPQRAVSGTLYTRFFCDNWADEPYGIPAVCELQGTIDGNTLTYSTQGRDYLWPAHLLPELRTSLAEAAHVASMPELSSLRIPAGTDVVDARGVLTTSDSELSVRAAAHRLGFGAAMEKFAVVNPHLSVPLRVLAAAESGLGALTTGRIEFEHAGPAAERPNTAGLDQAIAALLRGIRLAADPAPAHGGIAAAGQAQAAHAGPRPAELSTAPGAARHRAQPKAGTHALAAPQGHDDPATGHDVGLGVAVAGLTIDGGLPPQ
jgi:hypothetical protein